MILDRITYSFISIQCAQWVGGWGCWGVGVKTIVMSMRFNSSPLHYDNYMVPIRTAGCTESNIHVFDTQAITVNLKNLSLE